MEQRGDDGRSRKGTVTRGLRKYPEEITGKHSTDSLQKNCHTGNIAHAKESATTLRSLKPEW
jgi:hypothetical protein